MRATILGTVDGQDAFNTLWFLGAAPADVSALETLGDDLIVWVSTQFLPHLSNGYSVTAVNCVAQDSDTAPSVTRNGGLPATGAINSPTQAPQVAGVITFRTINRGRSGRGRNYIPGIPESALSSPGSMGSTFRNAMIAAYGQINPIVSIAGFTHVVVSHFHNKAPRIAGVAQTVLTYTMDAPLDTQRRRSVGRGA